MKQPQFSIDIDESIINDAKSIKRHIDNIPNHTIMYVYL